MSKYQTAINDRRIVRCFKTRPIRERSPSCIFGNVPYEQGEREIAAGLEYFWRKRPGVHRETFRFEFGSGRRGAAI